MGICAPLFLGGDSPGNSNVESVLLGVVAHPRRLPWWRAVLILHRGGGLPLDFYVGTGCKSEIPYTTWRPDTARHDRGHKRYPVVAVDCGGITAFPNLMPHPPQQVNCGVGRQRVSAKEGCRENEDADCRHPGDGLHRESPRCRPWRREGPPR